MIKHIGIKDIDEHFARAIGEECCRQRVGGMRELSIELGKKVAHGRNLLDDYFYGEWKIGSYMSTWRIFEDGNLICAGQDDVDSIEELDKRLSSIKFGRLTSITNILPFDIRVSFDSGIQIDFLICTNEDDDAFHIMGPDHLCMTWSLMHGWKIGKSNEPWL